MLEVGNGDWSLEEQKAHFALWCLMKAPLLLGNDLRNMTMDVWNIISNTELIAWNQDPLGKQGYRRSGEASGLEVWAGDLIHGKVALILLNRSDQEHTITAQWKDDLGLADDQTMLARAVWQHQDIGIHQQSFTALVPSHGVVAIELSRWDGNNSDKDNMVVASAW
jgi:alpha-galactosidase